MGTRTQTLKTSSAFPVTENEVWTVRDGKGRTAETWKVKRVSRGQSMHLVTVEITDHGLLR